MTLEDILIKWGLENREAKIYLALLELGPDTVQEVAKTAGVKRPTAYLVLAQLQAKGCVFKVVQHKKTLYTAEEPEKLLLALRTKEELLAQALPLFKNLIGTKKHRPKIKIYEGKSGIEQVYADMYNEKNIDLFGSIKEVKRSFNAILESWSKHEAKNKFTIREILTADPDDIEYSHTITNPSHQVRFLPQGLEFFMDCALYGNKIAILAVKLDWFAVVIESAEVVASFRSVYELAWRGAVQHL